MGFSFIPNTPSEDSKILNLEGLSAEEVMDLYMEYHPYDGLNERIDRISILNQLESGAKLRDGELTEENLKRFRELNEDLKTICIEIEIHFPGQSNCNRLLDSLFIAESMAIGYNNISKEVISKTNTSVEIKVDYTFIHTRENNITSENLTNNFFLQYDGEVWKINDYLTKDGEKFSTTFNETAIKEKNDEVYNAMFEIYNTLKKMVESSKELNILQNKIEQSIKKVIPSENIISVNYGNYNNDLNKITISIAHYFEEEWLVDDYLNVMMDSTKLFKKVFPIDNRIYQIQIIVKEKYKDNYGNNLEKNLAKVMMNKDTYELINWEGFESSNLNEITSVSFYGDSFYKSLKDLSNSMDGWQDSSNDFYPSGINGQTPSLCDDIELQCEEYGDCELYEIMQQQGQC